LGRLDPNLSLDFTRHFSIPKIIFKVQVQVQIQIQN
jgi:hypothetical protein